MASEVVAPLLPLYEEYYGVAYGIQGRLPAMPEELRVGSPEAWGGVPELPEWSFRRVAQEHGQVVLWNSTTGWHYG